MKKNFYLLLILIAMRANAQWQQTSGPGGGIGNLITVGNDFLGSGNGIYLSTDHGSSWKLINDNLTEVTGLAVSGSNIFAGTSNQGVLISADSGINWAPVNNGLQNLSVWELGINGIYTYASTQNGTYRSSDNGQNWIKVTEHSFNAFAFIGSNVFAGSGGFGIFVSKDNGNTWTTVNTGLTNLDVYALAVDDSNIFVGTDAGVSLSTNLGNSWTQTSLKYDDVFSIAITGPTVIASTSHNGIYITNDNGVTWETEFSGLPNFATGSVAAFDSIIFANTGEGLFSSTDKGENWTLSSKGLSEISINAIAFQGKNVFAASGYDGIYVTSDNGMNWTPVDNGLTGADYYTSSLCVHDSTIFVGTDGGVFYSNNSGNSWAKVKTDLTNFQVLSVAAFDKYLVIGAQNGVVVSMNNGTGWTTINSGLTNPKNPVYAIALSDTGIFLATDRGVYLSTDTGSSWSQKLKKEVFSIAIQGKNIFAGTYEGIYLSKNNGGSWVAVDSGLSNSEVISFAVSGNRIFAGTYGDGVFESDNNGSNWSPRDSGLTDPYVYALAANDTYLFAGTSDYSVLRYPLTQIVVTNINSHNSYNSLTNFPNPFSQSTNISFNLSKSQTVSLKIYNVEGKLISTLANQTMSEGTHQITWNAKDENRNNVPTGIYLLNLQTATKTETIKMQVVR